MYTFVHKDLVKKIIYFYNLEDNSNYFFETYCVLVIVTGLIMSNNWEILISLVAYK